MKSYHDLNTFMVNVSVMEGKSNLLNFVNSVIYAYDKEDILRFISVYEDTPYCGTPFDAIRNAGTFRALLIMEKSFGRSEVDSFIKTLKSNLEF